MRHKKNRNWKIYEEPKFLEALEAIHNIYQHIKFRTFDEVRYRKYTDETLEESEFTFRLASMLYNTLHKLDVLMVN